MKKLLALIFFLALPLQGSSTSLVIHRFADQTSAGGGAILVGDNRTPTTTAALGHNKWWHTWDGDFDGSGNSPYTAVKTGTVAKAVLNLGADGAPASNAKVCVYDSSENLIGCCSGAIPNGDGGDLELTTCDSISITNATDYWVAFAFDDTTQDVGTSGDTWKMANDTDDLSYATPPDPIDHVGGVNAGYPTVYVTD